MDRARAAPVPGEFAALALGREGQRAGTWHGTACINFFGVSILRNLVVFCKQNALKTKLP
jgi:hypothetical protein